MPPPRSVRHRPTPRRLLVFGSAGNGRLRWLVLAIAGLSLHQVAEALVPVVIGAVIDRAIGPHDLTQLLLLLAVLVAVFALLTLSWRTATRIMARVYTSGEHDLRLLAVERELDPRGGTTRRATGDVLAIASDDTANVAGMAWLIAEVGASCAAIITAVVALALISWPLSVIVIAATIVHLVSIHLLRGPLLHRSHEQQRTAGRAGAVATDFVTGIRVIKGLGAEPVASARFEEASGRARVAALGAVRASASLDAAGLLIGGAFVAVIAVAAGWFAAEGRIGIGELVTVVGLAQFVRYPLEFVGRLGAYAAAKHGSARRLSELLLTDTLHDDGDPDIPATRAGVDPGRAVVEVHRGGTAIRMHAGELLGIDPGRSSDELVDTLGMRVPLERGDYLVDGRDAIDLGPSRVRDEVYAPPRASAVFSGTILDNLHTPAASADAVAIAALDDVLERTTLGLLAPVGEQGRLLSGGQRQRLLLARALHQPHRVIVLTEPTSSVDSITEARIADALAGAPRAERTIVLVTTSPALLARCDRVVSIETEPTS